MDYKFIQIEGNLTIRYDDVVSVSDYVREEEITDFDPQELQKLIETKYSDSLDDYEIPSPLPTDISWKIFGMLPMLDFHHYPNPHQQLKENVLDMLLKHERRRLEIFNRQSVGCFEYYYFLTLIDGKNMPVKKLVEKDGLDDFILKHKRLKSIEEENKYRTFVL